MVSVLLGATGAKISPLSRPNAAPTRSICLVFGRSAKPAPGGDVAYTFETWGAQIADFCQEVVGTPAFLVGNSIGCIAAMQAAVFAPERSLGAVALNCSVRQLHERRRSQLPWYRSAGTSFVQTLLGDRRIARFLFDRIARPATVRRVLQQAYARSDAVTDELVAMLLEPASDEGALDVFRAFTRYSQGPLPEDLLAVLPCPRTDSLGRGRSLGTPGRRAKTCRISGRRSLCAAAGCGTLPPRRSPGDCQSDFVGVDCRENR